MLWHHCPVFLVLWGHIERLPAQFMGNCCCFPWKVGHAGLGAATAWHVVHAYGLAQHDRAWTSWWKKWEQINIAHSAANCSKPQKRIPTSPCCGQGASSIRGMPGPHRKCAVAVCSWLLRRIQGVLVLHYAGQVGARCAMSKYLEDPQVGKELHIVLTLLPMLSRVLPPETSVHLETTWGTSSFGTVHIPSGLSEWSIRVLSPQARLCLVSNSKRPVLVEA